MNDDLLNKLLERAEELDWICHREVEESPFGDGQVERYCIDFERYTPAGEDFMFTAFYAKPEDLPQEIMSYADDFDLDDHVLRWLEARRNGDSSVPNVVELVDDGRWIQSEIEKLAKELLHEKIRFETRTNGIHEDELFSYIRLGYALSDILDLTEGQCCVIYKADKFESGNKVLYIPDLSIHDIDVNSPNEDPVEVIANSWTGDDFIHICGGDEEKARKVFEYVDWQSPSTAFDEMTREGDFDA